MPMHSIDPSRLERLARQLREQRDGCQRIAAQHRQDATVGHLRECHEDMGDQWDHYHEVYADVVADLEAAFPWLTPEPPASTVAVA